MVWTMDGNCGLNGRVGLVKTGVIALVLYVFVSVFVVRLNRPQNEFNQQKSFKNMLKQTNAEKGRLLFTNYSFHETTDPKNTELVLEKYSFIVGDILQGNIRARDYNGHDKVYGGDFFYAVMRCKEADREMRLEITDHCNGSYAVTIPLLWPTSCTLEVKLLHPSESIKILENITSQFTPTEYIINSKLETNQKMAETTTCSLNYNREYPSDQLCDFTNPTNMEPWYCMKPKSGKCGPIIWEDVGSFKSDPYQGQRKYFDDSLNYNVDIVNSNIGITIKGNKTDLEKHFPNANKKCFTQYFPRKMGHTGYFENGKWVSLMCNNSYKEVNAKTKTSLLKCIQNKVIYFLGDSTIRQWFEYITAELKVKVTAPNKVLIRPNPRDGVDAIRNIKLHYMAHGRPLMNPGDPKSRPYLSDSLDALNSCTNLYTVIALGHHFNYNSAHDFRERLKVIKLAILRLQKRCPGVPVFVKHVSNYLQFERMTFSPWISYRHNKIMYEVFSGMENLIHLDAWDMTVVWPSKELHPGRKLLVDQISMWFSYIC